MNQKKTSSASNSQTSSHHRHEPALNERDNGTQGKEQHAQSQVTEVPEPSHEMNGMDHHKATSKQQEPESSDSNHGPMDHEVSSMDYSHKGHEISGMDHGHKDHEMSGMNHSHMNHEMSGMEHSHTDHEMSGMNHSHMNHEMSGMDHSHMNHEMSGMDHSQMDHGMGGMDHSMHMGNFKQKFWLSLVLAIPIVILSPMMGIELPFQFTFPGSDWVVLLLGTILFFYGGQPFLSGAKMELKQKSPAMMTLIAMGITVSYFYSLYAFIANHFLAVPHVMDFFWELATLIVIMLLGHWIEMNAVSNAGNALQKLAELLPKEVIRKNADGSEEQIPLEEVTNKTQLIVRSGDKIPTDGTILEGETTIDESAVTGESRRVPKTVGSTVIGGSVNGNGTITMEVTGTGEDSYLAKVMEMVRKAQADKSRLEALSDKVAKWLFYIALVAGVLAFAVWLFVADLPTALDRMVTVFVIACPHALGLAIPLVVARSTSIAAKNGLLLKNRNALENAHHVDYLILDKTGTLTEGTFTVTGIEATGSLSASEVLAYLAGLEKTANHPIAEGILAQAEKENITAKKATDVQTRTGIGLEGVIDGQKWVIVNQKGLEQLAIQYQGNSLENYQEQGNTISYLVHDGKVEGIVALGDKVKPEASQFIQKVKDLGITPVMATGDNQEAAQAVADYLGIEAFHAAMLPDDKERLVSDYVKEGKRVVMVGDGINDAPSLARATIGIAIGAGTDVAIDSADVVLTNSEPQDILHFLTLAKKTRRKMIQNLWWGAGYNIFAIPLAAGVLAPIGIILNPAVGAVLMSMSTIIVAINAMTLSIEKSGD
ncbi:heavy metal translocating P-type ATPase [Enterococcus casseliflavus]|uniref:heavy metal translocating P-type ATPase n=1 Tax=Enterococcus casseliflavus TaxID=37734 RepID=UPI002DBB5136|nr:copper-translocating P-type ATPase [Enterococcus casseliflavus]